MMSEHRPDDDFDATVQHTLGQVVAAVRPDPHLADRLVANVRGGSTTVVDLGARRRMSRVLPPLLAAAAIVILVVGGAVGMRVLSESNHKTARQPKPVHTKPFVPVAPVVPHFRAVNLSFSDAQHGWAIGDGQCATGTKTDCPALLATTNGGRSWRALGVPTGIVSTFDGASCGTNGNLSGPCVDAVTFANASDGYLWSLHEIYATTDGGRTWSRYSNPVTDWDGASSLVVVGDSVVRIAPNGQCSAGCSGSVQRAPLGTTQFSLVHPSNRQIGRGSSTLDVHGGDVYLFAGGVGLDSGGLSPTPGVFRSSNGGRTWQRIAVDPCGDGSSFGEYDFVTHDGLAVAWCGSGVRVATAGSATFSALRPLPSPDAPVYPVAAESADTITAADFSNSYNGDAGHDQTTFEVTGDGGRTWRRSPPLPVRGAAFTFATGSIGYAAAEYASEIYTTRDGGLTWTPGSFAS
jgi:photosystem II stability/assembly factor-like uncharacterized protein